MSLFTLDRTLIGMVHVGPLPGTPSAGTTPELLAVEAAREAVVLAEAGFDAIVIENMHDAPYLIGDEIGPEIVATMTRIGLEVEAAIAAAGRTIPIGVQILAAANRQALAVAHAIDAAFIRCENFVFAHVADEGLMPAAEAGALLRYRKAIDATDVQVFADIKKKHASHAVTADVSIEDAAKAGAFFGADALIVTGSATGQPADVADIRAAKDASGLPVLVGSGTTKENVGDMLDAADAVIVGSGIKPGGDWRNPVDPDLANAFVERARG